MTELTGRANRIDPCADQVTRERVPEIVKPELGYTVAVETPGLCRSVETALRDVVAGPDITWWQGADCVAVADAKYKRIASTQYPNADAYQMLAYCTALKQPRGYLIYALQSGEEPGDTTVRNANVTIAVRTLDVGLEPPDLLKAVDGLAGEIYAAAV